MRPEGKDEFLYECEDNITVKELLKRLKYSELHIPYMMAAINGILRNHDTLLQHDDTIVLFIGVGGG
jgi:molybdopterin converting factor small subunit